MKIVALDPPAGRLDEVFHVLRQRGHEAEAHPASILPSMADLASRCDVLILFERERVADLLAQLRDDPQAGSLPVAFVGDEKAGLQALEAGADIWISANEAPGVMALRLDALARRSRLGGAPRLDSLTGLIGRRRLLERLRHEFDRCARYRRSLGLLVVEPDPIEAINRDFGMEVGDQALRGLADLLRGLVRDVDILGRLSGKRFAMILPETDAGGALTAASRLRDAAEGYLFPALRGGTPLRLPVCVGVAAFPSRSVDTADDLLGRALEALGQARRRGGNTVVAFGAGDVIWSRRAPSPAEFE
ncbi:MAG: GGDEF domain-containing protein [Acidobacteriota bacterium]|nr:GGDEF domain-containing protein [Acidobacteriota bacterium]MDQ7088028.1 GGDEF domain-containing protein [Acidobacteriota bacterium]